MQLIVLGMHRSGTSVLARILNMMGAYYGPEGINFGASEENAKGFWERKDVLALHQEIMRANGADWDTVAAFDPENILENAEADKKLRAILLDLDAHRPWMIKDPRLCLLLPVWRRFLEVPVCIHIIRSPIQVAQSLKIRNSLPVTLGVAMWEKYNLAAFTASSGLPRILVSHRELMADPVKTVSSLYESLCASEVQGLRLPAEKEILAFIEPKLFRARGDETLQEAYVNASQKQLYEMLEDGSVLTRGHSELPALSAGAAEILREHDGHLRELEKLRADSSRIEEKARQEAALHQEKEAEQEARYREREAEREAQYKEQTAALRNDLDTQGQEADTQRRDLEKQLREQKERFDELRETMTDNEINSADLNTRVVCHQHEVEKLSRWIEMLSEDITATFNSVTWKIGAAWMTVARRALFIKSPIARDHIEETIDAYWDWKTGGNRQKKKP
ncbi:MAG: hypothetical protein GY862_06550 [Gammaproteobacteria bacterium]|nr:hypothetical protein [Gammaproteobacteria bacterium]